MGFASWLAFQSTIMIDASFRTFPSATKFVVSVISAVVGLLVLDKIRDMNHVVFQIKRLRVDGPDVLIFTSTSIVIFMAKKISHKRAQAHSTFTGFQSIPWMVLKAKLCLTRALVLQRTRSKHLCPQTITEVSSALEVQSLILLSLPLSSVDPRYTLRRQAGSSLGTDVEAPITRFWLILLYADGALGYIGALLGSVFAQIEAHRQSSASDGTNSNLDQESSFSAFTQCASTSLLVAGLICTCVFCATFALHYQRDLLRALFSGLTTCFHWLSACVSASVCVAWSTGGLAQSGSSRRRSSTSES